MNEQQIYEHIVSTSADIASIKTTLEETLKPLVNRVDTQETRLAATESDVRVWKRVFTGLWLLLVAGVAAVANWWK